MGDDNGDTRWLLEEMKATGARPVAVVWHQALAGKTSIEEAAAQRREIDSEEEIAACKELFQPPNELDAQRRLNAALEHAKATTPRTWRPWIAPLASLAAAVALFVLLPRDRGAMPDLPPYGPTELTSAVASVRGDRHPGSGEQTRHRMDSPVRWRMPALVDDDLQDSGASSLHVYATSKGTDRVRTLKLDVRREASGTFTMRASSLRDALGEDWPLGETRLTFVVTRPGHVLPTTMDEVLSCESSTEIQCRIASLTVE